VLEPALAALGGPALTFLLPGLALGAEDVLALFDPQQHTSPTRRPLFL
jgi:hypothetical protein